MKLAFFLVLGLAGGVFAADPPPERHIIFSRDGKEDVAQPTPAVLPSFVPTPPAIRKGAPEDLAGNFFKAGDYRNAIAQLRKALDADKSSPTLWRNLGSAYALGQDYDNAIVCYQRALKRNPHDYKAHYNLSLMHNYKGSPEELRKAEASAVAGLKENPGHSGLHSSLGNIYADQGRDQDAFREYRRALVLNPRDPVTRFNQGALHLKRREVKAAEQDYRDVLSLAPNDLEAAQNLAAIYIFQGRYPEAEKLNRWVISKRPKDEDTLENAYFNLGLAYDRQNRLEKAVNMYKLALQVAPWDAAAYVNTALILEKMDRRDEALAYWEKYQRLFPASRRNEEVGKRIRILKRLVQLDKNGDKEAPGESE